MASQAGSRLTSSTPLDQMTALERFNRALQIRTALEELMTQEEADMYLDGIDDHFDDYLRDLRIAYQETLGSI